MENEKSKPVTIILVHAAWFDGSSWNKVTSALQRDGYHVLAIQLPLTSFSDDVTTLRRLLEAQKAPVVLVGHSYGGAVITAAAADNPKVISLVYIAAIVPQEGETVGEVFGREAPHHLAPQLKPDLDGMLWLKEEDFSQAVAQDALLQEIALMSATQKPISVKCLAEPLGPSASRQQPSWFLVAENDRMLSPVTQRLSAKTIGAKVISLPVDHAPMFSRPDTVVELINEAAFSAKTDLCSNS